MIKAGEISEIIKRQLAGFEAEVDLQEVERVGRDLSRVGGENELASGVAHLARKRADPLSAREIGGHIANVNREDSRGVLRDDLSIDLRILLTGIANENERQRRVELDDTANRFVLVRPM